MYWNIIALSAVESWWKLNSNIRCIEIAKLTKKMLRQEGWIVTLDVLKCLYIRNTSNGGPCWIVTLDVLKFVIVLCPLSTHLLNSNIRCIEIPLKYTSFIIFYKLNSNIRCIEIYPVSFSGQAHSGWIVTLDVLKFFVPYYKYYCFIVE